MRFGDPDILLWLWAVLPAFLLLNALRGRRVRALRRLADPEALPALLPGWNPTRSRNRLLLRAAAAAFLILALARPQWGFEWQPVRRKGLDILVALDTSNSMLAQDVKPNRLQRAKWGMRDLVDQLGGDRIGLVAFAGGSFLQCPLTVDYAAFLMTLEDVYAGIIPRGGTDIEQALETCSESFDETVEGDRAIVLVTDGEMHAGDPERVIRRLQERHIRVYAVGVGTPEGELIPREGGQGGLQFQKDRAGHVVKTSLEEGALQRIAVETGGLYVRSAPGDFGLDRIVEQGLSRLKEAEGESRMSRRYEERYPWAVAAALLCLAWEIALGSRPPRSGKENAG
jgi:Ca-activated chloride channel homolog